MNVDRFASNGPGASGFPAAYWRENYGEPQIMDGVFNADRRAAALKTLFDSEYIDISSVVDLGFGLGNLLRAVVDTFIPLTVVGIDPSPQAYTKMRDAKFSDIETMSIQLEQIDLLTWCQRPCEFAPFDLGICTSVFQYLSDPEIEIVLPILAERVRYLYFSVPIDTELEFQTETLDFHDAYAIARSRDEYREMLSEHFTIVSYRLLESNIHFDEESTNFTDFLFRF